MPNVIACYKWVLDEQDIKIDKSTLALDTSRAKYKISDYDRNALEEAALIAQNHGGGATCLTFGTSAAKQSLKDALSRGAEKAVWVNDPSAAHADAHVTANVLASALRKIGSFDIILCGEGSADNYSQQVGPRLAALLGIPAITYVSRISIREDTVIATRKLGDCTEEATARFPVLVAVIPEINKPRIPGLKQVLAASKKPVIEWNLADLGMTPAEAIPRNSVKSIRGYLMSRKNKISRTGSADERVAGLVQSLVQEGLF
jgi:electron transfer flavoprotein beta subunit